MAFDFHVHGLWMIGSVTILVASLIAGNLEWVEGTTPVSFIISLLISLVLFLLTGLLWVSAAANAKD